MTFKGNIIAFSLVSGFEELHMDCHFCTANLYLFRFITNNIDDFFYSLTDYLRAKSRIKFFNLILQFDFDIFAD
jgi:hypothetical protein